MIYFLIFIGIAILAIWLACIMKVPKCGNMVLTTGGVKTGKTTFSVHMVLKTLKKQRRKVKVQNFFIKIFKALKLKSFENTQSKEMPLLYSNIPLQVPYVPLTQELIQRQERFVYGSVIYVCESSLVADSMSFKDDILNENMLLLNKLIGHETKGGYIFYDTQAINDNHFAIRRCLSTYFYIHHTVKIPFFLLMYVRELKYSDDNTSVNTFAEDVEDSLKLVIVPKSVWKKFDCYCYSILTDDLPVNNNVVEAESLKASDIITFKKYHTLKGKKKNENS